MGLINTLTSFYKGRRVLVTGHTGFKGSWLSIMLGQLGAEVTGLALDPEGERDLFVLTGLSGRMKDYRQDIRDAERVKEIICREQPSVVFHLAARALVLPSYEDPAGTFAVNTMGTVNLLEACRHCPSVRQLVIITTDKVYMDRPGAAAYREDDPLGGYDPYSASKAAAEMAAMSWRLSYGSGRGLSIATARAGNVIGGGDWSPDRLLPDCIRSLQGGSPVTLRNPSAIRPWQHVLEPLTGYLMLAMKMDGDPETYSAAWNFGPKPDSITAVGELVDMVIRQWGGGSRRDMPPADAAHETAVLRLDTARAERELGWRPLLTLGEAVEMTIDWYRRHDSEDAFELCMEQTSKYLERWNSASWR